MNYYDIDPQDFKEKITSEGNSVILDVRTEIETSEGFIEGYYLINFMDPNFPKHIQTLDREKTYFVYCRSGGRSAKACEIMSQLGFKKLYNLRGGILAWQEEGMDD